MEKTTQSHLERSADMEQVKQQAGPVLRLVSASWVVAGWFALITACHPYKEATA